MWEEGRVCVGVGGEEEGKWVGVCGVWLKF